MSEEWLRAGWLEAFHRVDRRIVQWMARRGITFLRWSVGIVFLWFGALKFFQGLSPAEELAARTIAMVSFDLVPAAVSLPLLAVWESAIGLGLLLGRGMRFTLLLLYLQMPGTLLPVVLFPGEVFLVAPFVPTLEGQYIIKNLVLISAGVVLGGSLRVVRAIERGGGSPAGVAGSP
jgi:uncharacterized membrane protein YphA (DoxX/SURF4 family)